ncbi:acid sphingomyelinase-like phosphodiesterase 3b [Grus japonensis]|uniref:Acid sphingomyelinase-like phosphodiesterase 3b n=1 Tax=Grus japonensis TaxID=30415 RepID=A0ABC9WBP3_GRUJA
MDLPLSKAESLSNGGSTSVVTYLRRGKNLPCNSSWKREVRLCERNNSADTKVSEEGGGGGALGTRAEIPLQPMMKTMVKQAVPLQPMKVHSGADIHLHPWEDPMLEQVDVPWKLLGSCNTMECLCCSKLLAGTVAHGEEPTLE